VIVKRRLEWSVLAFLFLLPLFSPLAYLALLISFIIWFRRWRGLELRGPSLYLLIFVVVFLLSSILSTQPLLSLGHFALFLLFPLTYLLFYKNIKDFSRKRILLAILASGVVVCLLGLLQLAGIRFELQHRLLNIAFHCEGGIRSTLGHPNQVAAFLAMITPLLFISALGGEGKWRWSVVAFLLLGLPVLLLTTSIGGIFALGLVALLFLLMRKRGLGIAVFLLMLVVMGLKGGTITHLIDRHTTHEKRFYTWKYVCPKIFRNHPFFGTGPGTYVRIYHLYGEEERILSTGLHNLYFRLIVETGIFGLFSFLLFLIACGRRIILYTRKKGLYGEGGVVAGCGFGMLALLFHGMVGDRIDFLPTGLLFFSIAGLGMGLSEGSQDAR
jgi:O-antigen ligase